MTAPKIKLGRLKDLAIKISKAGDYIVILNFFAGRIIKINY